MTNTHSSLALVAVGAVILLASLLADVVGIGDDPGFGRQQLAGTIFGAAVLAAGAWFLSKKDSGPSGD